MKTQPITNIDTAIRIYYAYPEIDNSQIKELFGIAGNSTLSRYKKAVLDEQAKLGIATMRAYAVDTKTAYKVWGIDIDDLVKRRKKLKELGFSA